MLVQERELHPSYICEGLLRLRYRGRVPMVSYTNCIIVLLCLPISVDLAWASVLGTAPWVGHASEGTKCVEMILVEGDPDKTRCPFSCTCRCTHNAYLGCYQRRSRLSGLRLSTSITRFRYLHPVFVGPVCARLPTTPEIPTGSSNRHRQVPSV